MRLIETLLTAVLAQGVASGPASTPALDTRQSGSTLTVDLTKTYQTIDGFGFSTAFQRANLITNMSDKTKQRQLLDLLFNSTIGAGSTIVRTGIGSGPDSSSDHMNTFAPQNPGRSQVHAQIPVGRQGLWPAFCPQEASNTYGVRTFYADAWSAPGYMKTNGMDTNGGSICGVTGASCSSGDWRHAYADYLVAYVKFYAQGGVNITHLGFLNEPEFAAS